MTLPCRLSTLLLLLIVAALLAGCAPAAPLPGPEPATAAGAATAASRPTAASSPTLPPTRTATPAPTVTPSPTPVPVPVHVLRTYPIDGDTDILPEAPLRIVFDQPMDPDPAVLGLTVEPELDVQVEWPAPDTLALRTAPRRPGVEYRLTLERARGRTGGELAQPLALTFGVGGKGAPLPILMYHHVDPLEPSAPAGLKEWTVSPEALAAQLDLLSSLGHVVPLIEVVDYLSQGAPLPARPAVITFDDGDKCTLANAIPALQARQLPATFFVPPQYCESGNTDFMNWDDVKGLAAAGFALGGHSYQHAYVHDLTPAEAEHQIGDEKRKIEEITGAKVECFAYPFGLYTQKTIEQLQHYGYRAALTIEQSVFQSPGRIFEMGRIRLGYDDSLDVLRSRLPWKD